MLCFPNTKINLGLYVTNRRDDGYHDLETVFYPLSPATASDPYLPLRDVLEIVPANETRLNLSGLSVEGDMYNNLVWKAYQLMSGEFPGKIPPLDIYLHKVIPMGAGLGGGSADGSFMLQLINDYCSLGLTKDALASYALRLGSDCPIFIYNTPMFARGRGEQMTSIDISLATYSLQLICPRVHVSTSSAFSLLAPRPAPFDLRTLQTLPVKQWKASISNDFEKPVFDQYPVLADIKQQLYAQGAIFASMSGTGSTIYGIFKKSEKAVVKVDILFDEFYLA